MMSTLHLRNLIILSVEQQLIVEIKLIVDEKKNLPTLKQENLRRRKSLVLFYDKLHKANNLL